MKIKILIAVFSLYLLAFSGFMLELTGGLGSVNSFIFLIADGGVFFLGLSGIRKNRFNLFFFLLLLFISFINYILHEYSFLTYINGLREILMVILVFSFYESIDKDIYKEKLQKHIERFMLLFLILQIPVAIYQYVLYGAGDDVGGTMGYGYSGILTLAIICMVFYRIKTGLTRQGILVFYNIIFLIPVFLNETKISFLLIPLMFLCLTNIKKIKTVFWSGAGAVTIFMVLNSLYSNMGRTVDNPFSAMFNQDFLEYYLMSDVAMGADVPRFTKIIAAIGLISQNVWDSLVGIEIGAFKGGTTIQPSLFAQQYDWLLLGSRPYIFFLLISGGWTMLVIMLYIFSKKLFFVRKFGNSFQFTLLLSVMFGMILFYNDAYRSLLFCYIYCYFVTFANGSIRNEASKEEKVKQTVG